MPFIEGGLWGGRHERKLLSQPARLSVLLSLLHLLIVGFPLLLSNYFYFIIFPCWFSVFSNSDTLFAAFNKCLSCKLLVNYIFIFQYLILTHITYFLDIYILYIHFITSLRSQPKSDLMVQKGRLDTWRAPVQPDVNGDLLIPTGCG